MPVTCEFFACKTPVEVALDDLLDTRLICCVKKPGVYIHTYIRIYDF